MTWVHLPVRAAHLSVEKYSLISILTEPAVNPDQQANVPPIPPKKHIVANSYWEKKKQLDIDASPPAFS